MLSFFLNDANFWYSCALGIVAALLLLEVIGMSFGLSVLGFADSDAAFDADASSVSELGSWLALDKLPLMVWLVLLLTSFGIIGLTLNFISINALGLVISSWVVLSFSIGLSFLATSSLAGVVAKVLPQQESTAMSHDDLVGTVGQITVGTAKKNSPAEGRFTDTFGQPHYLMIEPIESNEEFQQGDSIVLVQKQDNCWVATRYIEP